MLAVAPFSGDASEWNAFVRSQPGWSHFHQYGWKDAIERAFGHECIYLAARDQSRLVGVLPLVRVKSVLFGHYLVSMPFVNYGGPLGSPAAITALATEAAELAARDRVRLLELRSRVPIDVALDVSHRKVTVVRDLPVGGATVLWKELDAKLRSQIRRPQKEGVTVRFGVDEIEPFFTVFARHMRDLGTPTQPLSFFRVLAETFTDDMWFGCAYLNGKPVAGGAGFRWSGEFEMTWASALQEHKRIAPNMLLYWSFLERACDESLRAFNFGRCTPGGGTHRFKLQWGGREEQLWWYQRRASAAALGTPSPNDAQMAWGPRLWKHLPERVATALGPRIVRYIP
jgi:FemAB-related protein (PEP-CTERM system-associated)